MKNLVESIESRFCLNSTADEVLDVVGEKTAVERPFVARVLAAVTEAITSRGETVTYPTLLSGMIATLETKDAIDKEQVILSVYAYLGLQTTRCAVDLCGTV